MKHAGTISPEDLKLCLFTDSIEEAIQHLKDHAINKFGLKAATKNKFHKKWIDEILNNQ
jgi:hypothetical protein